MLCPPDQADRTAGTESVPVMPGATLNLAEVQRAKVLIVMPWLKHTNPMTAFSVLGLMDKRRTATLLNFGDAFVAHSRNRCVDLFLKSDLEWSFWIDDDMIVPFGNAAWFNAYTGFNLPEKFAGQNAIDRLLSHGRALVGGLYFGRHAHGKPMYSEACTSPQEAAFARTAPVDVIKPTRWVATGCMLVHRSVFLGIEKHFPRLARSAEGSGGNWFTSTEHRLLDQIDALGERLSAGGMTGEKALAALQAVNEISATARTDNSLGMGEDVAFCVRAAQAGFPAHVDLGLVCGHVGHAVFGPKNTTP